MGDAVLYLRPWKRGPGTDWGAFGVDGAEDDGEYEWCGLDECDAIANYSLDAEALSFWVSQPHFNADDFLKSIDDAESPIREYAVALFPFEAAAEVAQILAREIGFSGEVTISRSRKMWNIWKKRPDEAVLLRTGEYLKAHPEARRLNDVEPPSTI